MIKNKTHFLYLYIIWLIATVFVGLLFPNNSNAQDPAKEKRVEVIIGIEKSVKLDEAYSPRATTLGNESIVEPTYLPQKREIILKGKKPGETSLKVRNQVGDEIANFRISVTATEKSKVIKELNEFLGDVEGLEIGVKGDRVYIGGEIVVPSDIGLINIILQSPDYADVLNLVELSPHSQRIVAKKMQDEIQRNGLGEVTVRIVNKQYWLEGVVDSEGKKERAFVIGNALLPEKILSLAERVDSVQKARRPPLSNFITVNSKSKPKPVPKMIKLTAQFVELSKDYQKIFGFKWVPFLAGDGGSITFGKTGSGEVTTQSQGTLSGTISNLFPKLASAKSAGFARVIQSGVVITKNEGEANLKKNTTKPFAIGTGEFTKSSSSTAGFDLNVKPKILQQEKIELGIAVGVSSAVGDPPETVSNNIKTSVIVKNKESAVVGGIVISRSSTDFDKDPPFGQDEADNATPLFSFLRSKSYQTSKTQFVIFITPEIIESASTGTEKIKQKFRRRRR